MVMDVVVTSVLKQRQLPATVSSFYVSVLYIAMLRMSNVAVVLECFYFCPLVIQGCAIQGCVIQGCVIQECVIRFVSDMHAL